MQLTPAEDARSLAGDRMPGMAHVHRHRSPLAVRHATGADGHPLLLVRADGRLARALSHGDEHGDVGAILSVDDPANPARGRLWLSGWAERLDGDALRAAVLEFAAANPVGDLLDVGTGHLLYRLDVVEVRLARGESLLDVDVDDYLAAQPSLL